ncbi:MAG: MgtC/SapB family protein [Arachnia sp.]
MVHWIAIAELAAGVLFSVLVGLEREFNEKAAGLRTCALVGLGSALFTSVSRNGMWLMSDSLVTNVDGSRVAAQIVSGIGFLGAGLIFVRRDAVRGLTTAASVWLVAAIGMAAGAGVVDLAAAATVLYLGIVLGLQPLRRLVPRASATHEEVWIIYEDGHGVLRDVMSLIGERGVSVEHLDVHPSPTPPEEGARLQRVELGLHTRGGSITALIRELLEIPRVRTVSTPEDTYEK